MRLRSAILALLLATVATIPLAGAAYAQDRDCPDFTTQPKAQAAFDAAGPGDPMRLDDNNNGIACEDLPAGNPPGNSGNAPGNNGNGNADKDKDDKGAPDKDDKDDKDKDKEDKAVSGGQVSTTPRGGVDAGDGSSETDVMPDGALIVIGALGLAGVGGLVAARRSAHQ